MKTNIKSIIAFAACLLVSVLATRNCMAQEKKEPKKGHNQKEPGTKKPEVIRFDGTTGKSEGKKDLTVNAGSRIKVVLISNPSTGYTWVKTDSAEINTSDWQYAEKHLPAKARMVGGSKTEQHFSFLAKAKGKYNVTFNLVRPWEKTDLSGGAFLVGIEAK